MVAFKWIGIYTVCCKRLPFATMFKNEWCSFRNAEHNNILIIGWRRYAAQCAVLSVRAISFIRPSASSSLHHLKTNKQTLFLKTEIEGTFCIDVCQFLSILRTYVWCVHCNRIKVDSEVFQQILSNCTHFWLQVKFLASSTNNYSINNTCAASRSTVIPTIPKDIWGVFNNRSDDDGTDADAGCAERVTEGGRCVGVGSKVVVAGVVGAAWNTGEVEIRCGTLCFTCVTINFSHRKFIFLISHHPLHSMTSSSQPTKQRQWVDKTVVSNDSRYVLNCRSFQDETTWNLSCSPVLTWISLRNAVNILT